MEDIEKVKVEILNCGVKVSIGNSWNRDDSSSSVLDQESSILSSEEFYEDESTRDLGEMSEQLAEQS